MCSSVLSAQLSLLYSKRKQVLAEAKAKKREKEDADKHAEGVEQLVGQGVGGRERGIVQLVWWAEGKGGGDKGAGRGVLNASLLAGAGGLGGRQVSVACGM